MTSDAPHLDTDQNRDPLAGAPAIMALHPSNPSHRHVTGVRHARAPDAGDALRGAEAAALRPLWSAARDAGSNPVDGPHAATEISGVDPLEDRGIVLRSALGISRRGSMGRVGAVDRELAELIEEVIEAELLAADSQEFRVARFVAEKGQSALDAEARDIWERRVLPILSKPIRDQVAIASIIRRGGYVPRKIEL